MTAGDPGPAVVVGLARSMVHHAVASGHRPAARRFWYGRPACSGGVTRMLQRAWKQSRDQGGTMFRCTRRSSAPRVVVGLHRVARRRLCRRRRRRSPGTAGTTGVAETIATNEPATRDVWHRGRHGARRHRCRSDGAGRRHHERREPGGGPSGSPARASTTSRTRASRSRAARSCTASRPTPPTPGRRTGPAAPRAATSRSSAITDSLFAVTDDGEIVPLPRRVGRPQRRLHASGRCTSATASSSRTARRSTARP